MYIQITTRCNMNCAHCCMSATTVGEDMDRDTFAAAARLAEEYGENILLGGGEPTVHKLFWDFVGIALAQESDGGVGVITNGKNTKAAKRLAYLTQDKVLGAELSLDQYHQRIDQSVVQLFRSIGRFDQHIRTVQQIMPAGRALENQINTVNEGCPCDDLFVTPDGRIWACWHKKVQYGTVFDPDIPGDREPECSEKVAEEELKAA